MKVKGFVTAAAGVVMIAAFMVGCGEQESSQVRIHQLIAEENRQLRAQMDIDKQKNDIAIQQLQSQIKTLTEQLSKCEQQKQMWQDRADKGMKEQVDAVLTAALEQNAKMKAEIERLKGELAKLKEAGKMPAAIEKAPEANKEEPMSVQ